MRRDDSGLGKFLFRHKSRKKTAEPLVRHLPIRRRNFVQQLTHERRILIPSRLLKPLAPCFKIEKHFGEGLQTESCQTHCFWAIGSLSYEHKAKSAPLVESSPLWGP